MTDTSDIAVEKLKTIGVEDPVRVLCPVTGAACPPELHIWLVRYVDRCVDHERAAAQHATAYAMDEATGGYDRDVADIILESAFKALSKAADKFAFAAFSLRYDIRPLASAVANDTFRINLEAALSRAG